MFDTTTTDPDLVPGPRLPSDDEPAASIYESAPVRALVGVVTQIVDTVPSSLPASQALSDTATLLVQVERLRGALLDRIADVDLRQLYADDGAGSTGTWVAQQRTSLGRSEVALARRLSVLPTLAKALRGGVLSVEVAGRVARALGKLRPHVDRPDGCIDGQPGDEVVTAVVVDGVRLLVCEAMGGLADDDPRLDQLIAELADIASRPISQLGRLEGGFVALARRVQPSLLPRALGQLVDALLPAELEERADRGHVHRGFGLTRKSDGSGWRVSGDLDLECGELLDTVLRAELAVDPANPDDTTAFERLRGEGWRPGDDLPACDDGLRSARQRGHDALRNGLRRYLDAGLAGMRDKVAPHVSVTVSAESLHGIPGALPAVAASGATLPASLVRSWWCDSAVTRFILGLGRKVIETSHTERTLKRHERRAKHLETGGQCQGAGCTRGPGHPLIPHHATPWATCKTTSLADTVLLCEQTHHDLHSGHKTIRLKDGRWLNEYGWIHGPAAIRLP